MPVLLLALLLALKTQISPIMSKPITVLFSTPMKTLKPAPAALLRRPRRIFRPYSTISIPLFRRSSTAVARRYRLPLRAAPFSTLAAAVAATFTSSASWWVNRGEVIGIDMTEEQLTVARDHIDWHTEKFGYESPNVRFKQGYIEDLTSIGIKDDSVDIIISNCAINLSPNKEAVFKEIFRVLKPGGELFFSDVFADRRIPEKLQLNPTLLGECLGGALYLGDFGRLMERVGLSDSRIISQRELTIDDPDIKAMAGMITFYSVTVRAFKLNLDESRENFAQVARYLGTIAECPDTFVLDADLQFATEEPVPICSNTAMMLSKTRLAKHFKVHGDCAIHYGAFNPSPKPETDINLEQPTTGCC